MGFTTGAKSTQDIFEDIVNGLIVSGVWHNVYIGNLQAWQRQRYHLNGALETLRLL